MPACAPVPSSNSFRLINARVPVDLAPALAQFAGADGLASCEITVESGRVTHIATSRSRPQAEGPPCLDMREGVVLPRFVDIHTHLDKGHIIERAPNADGTHLGARNAVIADREANWTAEDVAKRMDFSLRCAFAHGTSAIRTHIDSLGKQAAVSWPVLEETRRAWKGRIALQGVALFPAEMAADDESQFKALVELVARHGGLLGGNTYFGAAPDDRLQLALDRLFGAAAAYGLDLDFHVDESASLDALSLEEIAKTALRTRFKGRITVGHCCSLALVAEADRCRIIDRVGEAGVAVVSLPMCNMYLQDRRAGRTPRWRGVTPLQELEQAGVTTLVASDNTRDPFYGYGDLDMIEVFRESTRILQLDHSDRRWTRLFGATAADVMGLPDHGRIKPGCAADLVLLGARTVSELVTRPQSDRVVLVSGVPIDAVAPDYRELGGLFTPKH